MSGTTMEDGRTETALARHPHGTAAVSAAAGLVARARAGEGAALAAIYHEHGARMLEIAVRIAGCPDEAEDVVQDVLVGLPEALHGYDASGPLGAWLRRITIRTALLRLRRRKRRLKWHRRAAVEGPTEERPGAVEARLTLERVLRRMPEDLRAVYVLKEVEGYSHGDIGALLGITPGASEVRLHRARRFLKERLQDRL